MKLRYLFFAFVLAGILAATAMAGAFWIVTVAYGGLGSALEQRQRHSLASADLLRLIQSGTRSEADAASTVAEPLQQRWTETGATEEELKILGEMLAKIDAPEVAAVAMQGGSDPVQRGWSGPGASQSERALKSPVDADSAGLGTQRLSSANRLIEMADARTKRSVDTAMHDLGSAIGIAIAAMAFVLLLIVGIALLMSRSMLRPVRRLAHAAESISERNDPAPFDARSRVPELQVIAKAFNDVTDALENEIRARLRMTVELQKARSAADSAVRARDAALLRMQSEAETKAPQFAPAPLDLQALISEALSRIRPKAAQKKLDIAFDVDPDLIGEPRVIGDASKLSDVLTHLLSNAVRFTDKGEVRLSVFTLEARDDELVLCFTVTDTGRGMSAVQIANLFSEEETAHTLGADERTLGASRLCAIKRLVETMGGDIDVESEPGTGSCFHFTVLVRKEKSAANVVNIGTPRGKPRGPRRRRRNQNV
jgi:signal transduction histidine kinase